MKSYDDIEEEAKKSLKKKPKMKVSGKSVFLLNRASLKSKKKK